MRATHEQRAAILAALRTLDPLHLSETSETYRAAGLSPVRFRWDAIRAARFDVCPLYRSGHTDRTIDTAIRACFRTLGNVWAASSPLAR